MKLLGTLLHVFAMKLQLFIAATNTSAYGKHAGPWRPSAYPLRYVGDVIMKQDTGIIRSQKSRLKFVFCNRQPRTKV